jgi:hypothetical protein
MPGLDWVFPVAGQNEWSRGSWMPDTLTHRDRTHAATDIYAAEGTPIMSSVAGRVESVSSGEIGGNFARIRGDDGIIYYYAHMQHRSPLVPGTRIEKAQLVGFVGNTGSAKRTKPHLHFSMRSAGSNTPINPAPYLEGGYRLDALPGTNYNPETGEETVQTYNPDTYGYATPAELVDAVMGDEGQGPEPATASQIVGGIFSTVSNTIAGGERMDYRGLGTTGVRQADLGLLIKEPGMTSSVEQGAAPTTEGGLQVKEVGRDTAVQEVQGG